MSRRKPSSGSTGSFHRLVLVGMPDQTIARAGADYPLAARAVSAGDSMCRDRPARGRASPVGRSRAVVAVVDVTLARQGVGVHLAVRLTPDDGAAEARAVHRAGPDDRALVAGERRGE